MLPTLQALPTLIALSMLPVLLPPPLPLVPPLPQPLPLPLLLRLLNVFVLRQLVILADESPMHYCPSVLTYYKQVKNYKK